MMTPTAEYDDNIIRELVSALSDTARTARAQKQLLHLVSSGGATTVLGLLLDRLLGQEGVRGTGARRAVAKLLEEAMSAAGVDGLPALPRLVALSARVLGDGEATVRDSFAQALASAARSAGSSASGREILNLLVRPLLKVLDGRQTSVQQGGGQALREVVKALQPHQLRPCAPPIIATLRRHLRTGNGTHGGRPALLECAAALLGSVPETCGEKSAAPVIDDFLSASVQAATSSDWHERLGSVALLEMLAKQSL